MKKLLIVISVVLICSVLSVHVFALTIDDVDKPFIDKGSSVVKVDTAVKSVWSTVVVVVQALAVGAVVFAGLRYMFASADSKADIKKSMSILALGAILVFCATTVLRFIVSAGEEIL